MKRPIQYLARIKGRVYGPFTPQDKAEIDAGVYGIRWITVAI